MPIWIIADTSTIDNTKKNVSANPYLFLWKPGQHVLVFDWIIHHLPYLYTNNSNIINSKAWQK